MLKTRLLAALAAFVVGLAPALSFAAVAAPAYTSGGVPAHATGVFCLDLSGAYVGCGGGGGSGGVVAVATTDKSGTITTGGTAQNAIASNASRKGWCIQNTDAAEVMYVRANGVATTTATKLTAGQQVCSGPTLVDTAAISVLAATTAHPWAGFEVQ